MSLQVDQTIPGQIRLSWSGSGFVVEVAPALEQNTRWTLAAVAPTEQGGRFSVFIPSSENRRFFRLRQAVAALTRIEETSPAQGESGVAVTRETVVRLTAPLAASAVIGNDQFFAQFGARRILTRIHIATDRRTLTLFYLELLPSGARVHVTLRGEFRDESDRLIDLDGDGQPGGSLALEFETLSIAPVPQTSVAGRVFASQLRPSAAGTNTFVNVPLGGVTITVDGMEETLRAVTDTMGNFRLEPVPAGEFFVHIDGRTVTNLAENIRYPDLAYYPNVGKKWLSEGGTNLNIGEIYLPLIPAGTLQPAPPNQTTVLTFRPDFIAANPQFDGVSVTVPPNALYSDSGQRGGMIGIAPVPPDRLPGPVPDGLPLQDVITIQTDGASNFDMPIPACFPNLPDPKTGEKLPPGAKSALWSFNHDTGRFEVVGSATVSADGQLVCTDPGVGIPAPGWHGTAPGTEAEGGDLETDDGGRTRARCPTCQPSNPTDPVNLFSGEFTEMSVDLVIRGRGMDFTWQRFYRSQLGFKTILGHNWNYSYNYSLERAGTNLLVRDGASRADEYRRQPNGIFVAEGFFRELMANPDGTHTLTLEEKDEWRFLPLDGSPQAGRISSVRDRFGNRLSFQYDAGGRLDRIIDTLDREIRLSYNAAGLLAAITDFAGRSVRYEYYDGTEAGGGAGDLKAVVSPAVTDTPNGNDFPTGKRTSYTYTAGFRDEELNHNLLTIIDGRRNDPGDPTFGTGPYLINVYAPTTDPDDVTFDRVIRQTWGGGVIDIAYVPLLPSAANGGVTLKAIVNDRNGNVKEYFHDRLNRVVREREYTGRANPVQPTTELVNRPANRLRADDPEYFETINEWDSDSLLKRTIQPNGNLTEYVYEKDLNPSASPRARGNLRVLRHLPGTHVPAGDQSVIEERFQYDNGTFNLLTQYTDARGNITTYEYDTQGNLTRVRYPAAGNIAEFEYNSFGQLTATTAAENDSGYRRRDEFTYYDSGPQRGYLRQQIVDAATLRLATTFEYDARGNVARLIDPRGNDTLVVRNALDQVVQRFSEKPNAEQDLRYRTDYFYDANNNLVQVDVENRDAQGTLRANDRFTVTREFDHLDNLTRVWQEIEEGRGLAVEYQYDLNRNLLLTRTAEAVAGRQPANVVQRQFDERDMLFRTTRGPGDPRQNTVQIDYDRNGNVRRILQGLESQPRESRFTYDGFDRLVLSTDPLGNAQKVHYNPNGDPETEIFEGELLDGAGSSGNTRLSEVHTSYDSLNRPSAIEAAWFRPGDQSPLGAGKVATRFEYAPNSSLIRTINANGHSATTTYDTANRPAKVVDLKGNETRMGYNANSSLVRVIDIEKSLSGAPDKTYQVDFEFDNLERQVSVTDNSGNTSRYAYDSRGLRTQVTDAVGNITQFHYDGAGRPVETVRLLTADGTGAGAVVGSVTTRAVWDDNSRVLERIDPNGHATGYQYDALDRPVRILYPDGTSSTFDYDVHGNDVRVVDPNGTVVSSVYDALDRLLRREVVPGPGVAPRTQATAFRYDGLGRMVEATNENAVLARSYDSLSRPLSENLNGRVTSATYDPLGNVLSTTYPGGRQIGFEYDELERLASIEDAAGLLARYLYEGRRRTVARELRNSTRTTYTHDPLKHIEEIAHLAGTGAGVPFNRRRFTWDALHNKRADTELHAAGISKTLRYDSLYRLNQSVRGAGQAAITTQYDFDSAGNWTRKREDALTTDYLALATVPEPGDAQMNQYSRAGAEALTHDQRGNLLSGSVAGGTPRHFEFDAHDQLVAAEVNGLVTRYRYDPLGRRIEKVVESNPPQTIRYFYAGVSVCEEQDQNGRTLATYVSGQFVDDLVSRATAAGEIFYHQDDQRNVVALTDDDGQVIEMYHYDDYGETVIMNSAGQVLPNSLVGNNYRFQGRPFDSETGLYEYRTRYLDPRLGRFISRDAIGAWGDLANLGNGYAFVGNNPWSRLDPFGFGRRSNQSSWDRFNSWIDSNPAGLGYVKAFFQLLPDSVVTGSVTLANAATLGQSTTISEAAAQAQDQMGLTQGERTALKVTAGITVAAAAAAVAVEAAPVVANGLSSVGGTVNNAILSTSVRVLGTEGTLKAGAAVTTVGTAVVGAYGGGGGAAPSLGAAGAGRASGVLGAAQRLAARGGDVGKTGEGVTRAATRLANIRLENAVVQGLRGTGTSVGRRTADAISSGTVNVRFVDRIFSGGREARGLYRWGENTVEIALRGRTDLRGVAGTVAHEVCHYGQWRLGSVGPLGQGYNLLHELEAAFWGRLIDPRHVPNARSVADVYRAVINAFPNLPPPPPGGNPVDMTRGMMR